MSVRGMTGLEEQGTEDHVPALSGRLSRLLSSSGVDSRSLPWDRFSAWLHCLCVVGFDLELGQTVEVLYPKHAKLTDKEKSNICYLSFPDSNSGCLGDTQFCFRFRQSSGRKVSLHCLLDQFQKDSPLYLKSLVMISKLPYVTFFHTVLKQIAPEYFEKNEPCLEAACCDIDRWPAPSPGKTLNLPIMGVVMKVRIPTCYDKPGTSQLLEATEQTDALISITLPTVHEVDLFSCISPLKYCCDFRPYFTIHDTEFKEYTTRTQAPPSIILGVTNPFFAKTLQHWPPLQKTISPWKSPPQLRPFSQDEFIKTLEKTGPQLTSRIKADWIGLYRHFLKSLNFDGWFRTRRKEMTQKLEALHLEALCDEDLLVWIQKHTEVEAVDLVLKLKNKLFQANRENLPVKPSTLEKLQMHIDTIIVALPEDLHGILLTTGPV